MNADTFLRPEKLWRTIGLKANQTVVHLGCGAGFYLIPAAKIVGPKGRVIGLDIRPDMLSEADSRAKRAGVGDTVRTMRVNLEGPNTTSLPDKNADWVLIANILHQAEPAKILAEATRLIKPAGAIVVVEWDTISTPLGPPPEKRVEKNTVIEVAQSVGLGVLKEFSPSPYHFGLVLQLV